MTATTPSPATAQPPSQPPAQGEALFPRLLSLDFMRGLVMILLALEAAGLYDHLYQVSEGSFLTPLTKQFFHHPWHGLRAWDLVQPAFMFMAGAAMAFSLHSQQLKGMTWTQSFYRTVKRCAWLFFWGVLGYAVRRTGLSFELWNVLTQLSFTTLVAFLIFQWPVKVQITVCAGLLLITEALYRFTHVPGFDQPFTNQHNFGNYMDLLLMHKINSDGWVAINCIPTAVHTIGGALAGKLLLSGADRPQSLSRGADHSQSSSQGQNKIKTLLLWGLITLLIGYALDWTGTTPIIKRIATSSFTLVSLGYSLLLLALCYWWIDGKPSGSARLQGQTSARRPSPKGLKFFTIVGMNSIFLYLFFEIVGHRWFNDYVAAITNGLIKRIHMPDTLSGIITSLAIFALEWGLCYFLYKKKIFFKV